MPGKDHWLVCGLRNGNKKRAKEHVDPFGATLDRTSEVCAKKRSNRQTTH